MERSYLGETNITQDSTVRLRATNRLDVHVMEQLQIQRKNLSQVCKMCVKSIVDKSPFEVITDDCPHLNNLCVVLEHMFLHRIQARWSIFSSNDSLHYWHIIQQYSSPLSIGSIDDMENVLTDLGKCRAWLRLCLVQKRLSAFMNLLVNRQSDLKLMYMQGAFMTSQELAEVAGFLKCLDAIDFNLCLRDQNFDFGEHLEIDYSPYLSFNQSNISRIDDIREEQRLASHNNVSPHPGDSEESSTQLRELLKIEREQKNYYEELVSVKESQIDRLQKELDDLGRENGRQKTEMEEIVLELQQQITKLQSELRQKSRQQITSSRSQSPNRRSGLFSSIFGSGDT